MKNLAIFAKKNGYSDSMIRFFADATYPFSENTLNMILKKRIFFIFICLMRRMFLVIIKNIPTCFLTKKRRKIF